MSTDLERSRLDSSKVGITVTRTCAVCESSQKRTLFDQPLVVPSRCTYGSYTVVACEQCGFIYADNTITQEASDGHYAGPNKVTREFLENGEPDRDVKRLDNTAAAIGRFLKRETSVLDIGCGTGRLIGRLKEVGFARVCGLDQSAVAAEIARREYAVEVRTGSVFDEQEGRFGLAIVCHVLEHIVDLPTCLRRIYALLEDDGMTYIEVPDVRQFDRFVDPASSGPWIYVRDLFTHFTPGHVNFFSTVSLRNLMTRFGFDEVSCQSAPMGVVTSVWRRRSGWARAGDWARLSTRSICSTSAWRGSTTRCQERRSARSPVGTRRARSASGRG